MEERNVKLSLDKAKEWYKKGGELREIALQAFSEKELKDYRSHSWEEYTKKHKQVNVGVGYSEDDKMAVNVVKTYFDATCALWKLLQLRQEWVGDWKPIYYRYFHIVNETDSNEIRVYLSTSIDSPLSFPAREMADEFVADFRDLLKIAKPLL